MMERPRFHFTAPFGYLNDPNGLVCQNGIYHLYYQHIPESREWVRGGQCWGHATSTDLLNWEHQPIALRSNGADLCFSGSAIIDHQNVSGFQTGSEPPLLVFYTSTGRGECIAYSNDGGMTFTEYSGNPVVQHNGRDPKIVYHKESGKWIMTVFQKVNFMAFYASDDLKHWTFLSRIHGFRECPELIQFGDTWALFQGNGVYSLGTFDGETFEPTALPQPLYHGDAYAGQCYSNTDRKLMIAWMMCENEVYDGMPFVQQMTLPLELSLKNGKIYVNPAVEVPEKEILSSPDKPMNIDGVEIPPAEYIEVIRDTMSVEIFLNHGEHYYVKALRR